MRYIKKQGFKVETTNYVKDLELPYQLNISKINSVDIAAISSLTQELRKKVKEFKGEYDGWETIVMKD